MRRVGREGSRIGHRKIDLGGNPAFGRHREQTFETRVAVSSGPKYDLLSVGSPTDHGIAAGMIRQALRFAARCGHDEHVHVAVVFSGECDRAAVGRKDGIFLNAGTGREMDGVLVQEVQLGEQREHEIPVGARP